MKFTLSLVAGALLISNALCADIASEAKTLADKEFKLTKEASALMAKVQELCKEQQNISQKKLDLTKSYTAEQMQTFQKEYKYQTNQNVAKLSKDEPYFRGICKMNMGKKRAKPMPTGANAYNGAKGQPGQFQPCMENCQAMPKPTKQPTQAQ